jgi:hypothetical protein
MDIWGPGTLVTVSSGKNGLSGVFILCSFLWGFLSIVDWSWGDLGKLIERSWEQGCLKDFRASMGFLMPLENWNKGRHVRHRD